MGENTSVNSKPLPWHKYLVAVTALTCISLFLFFTSARSSGHVQNPGSSRTVSLQVSQPPATCKLDVMKKPSKHYRRSHKVDDLELLYRTGLYPDLAPWKGKQLDILELYTTLTNLRRSVNGGFNKGRYCRFVIIKNNTVYVPDFGGGPRLAGSRFMNVDKVLRKAQSLGLKYEDSVFIMNAWDQPTCPTSDDRCRVPVLSFSKKWDYTRNTSNSLDILVPIYNHNYQTLMNYTWGCKKHQAMMRAGIKIGMPLNCTRAQLVVLVNQHPELKQWLDIGLTGIDDKVTFAALNLTKSPRMPLEEHPQWKYLISADGQVAATRLAKLMGMNSVVLKEDSPWIEYFYRALLPEQHYFSFNIKNISEVIQQLEATPDEQLMQVTNNAQRFQQLYTTDESKILFTVKTISEYNKLFKSGVMQKLVDYIDVSRITNTTDVLDQMEAYLKVKKDKKEKKGKANQS